MIKTSSTQKVSTPLPSREEHGGGSLYGLLGYPLGHSFSRAFFNKKFAQEGIDAEYVNFELPDVAALPALLAEYPNLRGFNVTIPHKQAVIPYLDALSDEARAIGAVNVVKVVRSNGRTTLTGYNSDIIGFMDSIRPLLQPHHRRALVLGTGGASKAICRGLERLGLEWRYVSRQRSVTSQLPSLKGGTGGGSSEGSFTYSDITPALLADYTVIVNCTPLGMYPRIDAAPELPYAALSPRHLLYDLVYNPDITLFMRQGRRFGATVKGGLEMLHRQAVAAWEFWNNESL